MTWLLLIATIAAPYICFADDTINSTESIEKIFGLVVCNSILWLFIGSPLVISLVIAYRLKYGIPAFILLFSTIIYGLWFGFIVADSFINPNSDFFMLPTIAIGSIFFLLPLWFLACIINLYCIKKETPASKTLG
jgi:hypothetical protein